jgi:hypothetical protein
LWLNSLEINAVKKVSNVSLSTSFGLIFANERSHFFFFFEYESAVYIVNGSLSKLEMSECFYQSGFNNVLVVFISTMARRLRGTGRIETHSPKNWLLAGINHSKLCSMFFLINALMAGFRLQINAKISLVSLQNDLVKMD